MCIHPTAHISVRRVYLETLAGTYHNECHARGERDARGFERASRGWDTDVSSPILHQSNTTSERKDIMESTVVTITDKNSDDVQVHKVTNLHLLRCSALQRLHQLVTCDCALGMNEQLCLAKLHAMSQASEAYTLGALDLNQNVKDELVDVRAQGNRRMSDEDIKTLGKSTSSSGVKSVATIMRIDTELHDARANVMNVTKIRDPDARRKALLH